MNLCSVGTCLILFLLLNVSLFIFVSAEDELLDGDDNGDDDQSAEPNEEDEENQEEEEEEEQATFRVDRAKLAPNGALKLRFTLRNPEPSPKDSHNNNNNNNNNEGDPPLRYRIQHRPLRLSPHRNQRLVTAQQQQQQDEPSFPDLFPSDTRHTRGRMLPPYDDPRGYGYGPNNLKGRRVLPVDLDPDMRDSPTLFTDRALLQGQNYPANNRRIMPIDLGSENNIPPRQDRWSHDYDEETENMIMQSRALPDLYQQSHNRRRPPWLNNPPPRRGPPQEQPPPASMNFENPKNKGEEAFLPNQNKPNMPPNVNTNTPPPNLNWNGPPPNWNGPPPNWQNGPPPNWNQVPPWLQPNANGGPPPNWNGPSPNGPPPHWYNNGPPPNWNQPPPWHQPNNPNDRPPHWQNWPTPDGWQTQPNNPNNNPPPWANWPSSWPQVTPPPPGPSRHRFAPPSISLPPPTQNQSPPPQLNSPIQAQPFKNSLHLPQQIKPPSVDVGKTSMRLQSPTNNHEHHHHHHDVRVIEHTVKPPASSVNQIRVDVSKGSPLKIDANSLNNLPPGADMSELERTEILMCNGSRWEVPAKVYACCGQSVYRRKTEHCSAGSNLVVALSKLPTTTTSSPQSELSCKGRRFLISKFDANSYACCGTEVFFWPTEKCIEGKIWPPRPSISVPLGPPKTASTMIICEGKEHWVPPADRFYLGCCGDELIDNRHENCGALLSKKEPAITMVGAIHNYHNNNNNNNKNKAVVEAPSFNSLCPSMYICCDDFSPVLNENNSMRCCPGSGPTTVSSPCPSS